MIRRSRIIGQRSTSKQGCNPVDDAVDRPLERVEGKDCEGEANAEGEPGCENLNEFGGDHWRARFLKAVAMASRINAARSSSGINLRS